MNLLTITQLYKCTLIVKEQSNKSDIQLFAYNYFQLLKKLGALDISAIVKNDYELSYPIKKINNVMFIELSFKVAPNALNQLKRSLKLDESVLRYFIVKLN